MLIRTDNNSVKTMVENIIHHTRDYLQKSCVSSVIVGMSGGIDSTVAAALVRTAIEQLNGDNYGKSSIRKVKLIGRGLPIVTNKRDEIYRANQAGNILCHDYATKSLSLLYRIAAAIITPDAFFTIKKNRTKDQLIRLGNIKARLRMIYLYNLARKNDGLVLSTDNYTEFLLGFWTLHGDVGDLAPIQNLWKSEVYAVADYFAGNVRAWHKIMGDAIDAIPTDGLGVSSSDFDQIGTDNYRHIDIILKDILMDPLTTFKCRTREDKLIYDRHRNSEFKRENPFNISREDIISPNLKIPST